MPEIINLLGQVFGRLKVVEFAGKNKHNHATWLCVCDCGQQRIVESGNLRSGNQVSCGCQSLQNRVLATTKHGLSGHPLHRIWRKIIERCYNPNCKSFPNYGGKGVVMSDEWRDNFQSFYDWAIANGWRKGLEIDKDIKGNGLLYSAETCSIVTRKENINNTTRNVYITIDGVRKTAAQWSEIVKIPPAIICRRIRQGWEHKNAVYAKPRYLKANKEKSK